MTSVASNMLLKRRKQMERAREQLKELEAETLAVDVVLAELGLEVEELEALLESKPAAKSAAKPATRKAKKK